MTTPPGPPGNGVDGDPPPSPGSGDGGPRTWPRRLLIATNAAVLVCLLGAGAGYGYVRYRVGQIRRVAVSGTAAAPGADAPKTVLLIGSDTRAGNTGAQAQQFGSTSQVSGQRSDTIVLVHLVPRTGKAAMLSIPRDTLVHIAGTNGSNKINAAFDHGPSQLVQTITEDFGIPIHHVVQVDFSQLEGLVNTVGGVCMSFPYPARDAESGLNVPTPGNHHLDGAASLALVRSRFYQYQKGGQWVAEGTGDLGRIKRQHEFLRVLASTAVHQGLHNPFTANALVTQAVRDVTVDRGLTTSALLRLVAQFRSAKPATIPSWTLPTTIASNYQNYGDVLLPKPAQDAQVISTWRTYGTTPPPTTAPPATLAPARVSVRVENGSGVTGQAGQAARALRAAGFGVTGVGDAPSYHHPHSVVSYAPGNAAAATTVAGHVPG
ncbi:MAG TPA: LCP family protein, partial [Acidimicrobiales bacterium]|nr:LCP family protein [Acidimicrobiales bacterium]